MAVVSVRVLNIDSSFATGIPNPFNYNSSKATMIAALIDTSTDISEEMLLSFFSVEKDSETQLLFKYGYAI